MKQVVTANNIIIIDIMCSSLDALHCVGCESLLVPQRVQELPYRWVLGGYQRVEGVELGLQGVGCPGRATASFFVVSIIFRAAIFDGSGRWE